MLFSMGKKYLDPCYLIHREALNFVDQFTATYAPLAARPVRILPMNQYA
jgi:hypothetical protein